MNIKIALAGNPNSGKTTLFNLLTGSNQFVGNWPGVTVEKKEGKLKKHDNVIITDLPGIYSLSPYTLEEVVARDYLIDEKPDVILNIVDGTNLERNLYLTTQLIEIGIPVIVAINMIDVVKKNGDEIDTYELSKRLGCKVVEISALNSDGVIEAVEAAIKIASNTKISSQHIFCDDVEQIISYIEENVLNCVSKETKRWYAIKIFERDEKVIHKLKIKDELLKSIEEKTKDIEKVMGDDVESIIINERYFYITSVIKSSYKKRNNINLSTSHKIDKIITNRFLAFPIFTIVMFLVYFISVTTVGAWATNWANNGVFGEGWHLFGVGSGEYLEATNEYIKSNTIISEFEKEALENNIDPNKGKNQSTKVYFYDDNGKLEEEILVDFKTYNEMKKIEEPNPNDFGIWIPGIPVLVETGLDALNCAKWLKSLILDGIISGVGAVLGFVPQILVLFLLLAFLESSGYMARIAFIMDKIFRKFGLSGKSFIPILIGTGCGVPGIMASRTIENDKDRKITIITTTFIPCSAKLPIIALISGALFGGAWWVAPSAYFIGILAIVVSGIILKKTRLFKGDAAPFVMELPAYHLPTLGNLLYSMWERGWSFIKKAGTIILLSSIILWILQSFGIENGAFVMVEDLNNSILASVGSFIAIIFAPLGWGTWQGAVATITGLIAKENIVSTFGILFGGFEEVAENGWQIWTNMKNIFTPVSAYSFLIFNLLCAPCFAAIGAIRKEMNNWKWTYFAIGYQTGFAYIVSFIVYQFGMFFTGGGNFIGTCIAGIVTLLMLYLLFRPYKLKEG